MANVNWNEPPARSPLGNLSQHTKVSNSSSVSTIKPRTKNLRWGWKLDVGQIENSCKISEWEDNLSFFTLPLNLGQCDYDRTNKILASRKCWYNQHMTVLLTGACGEPASYLLVTSPTNIVSDHITTSPPDFTPVQSRSSDRPSRGQLDVVLSPPSIGGG